MSTTPTSTGVWFYVPVGFDVSRHRKLRGVEDEAHWLLNRIVCLTNTYRHSGDQHVNISAQTMRAFMQPSVVTKLKDVLIKNRKNCVIECDGVYRPEKFSRDGGGKSLGYRLAERYRGDLKRVECRNRRFAARVLRHRIIVRDEPLSEWQLDDVHQYLYRWLTKLRINANRAYTIIDGLSEKPRKRRLRRRGRRRIATALADNYAVLLHRKAMCRMTVDDIDGQSQADDPRDFVVDKYGRVHTAVTRLLTQARTCMSIDGQPLHGIDIRNSQLVFFVLLMLESFCAEMTEQEIDERFGWYARAPETEEQAIKTIISEGDDDSTGPVNDQDEPTNESCSEAVQGGSAKPTSPRSIKRKKAADGAVGTPHGRRNAAGCPTARESAFNLMKPPEDVRRFIDLVIQGMIYDVLMEQVGITDRKKFKGAFFRVVLYGDPKEGYVWGTKLYRLFRDQFPTVLKFVEWAKRYEYEDLARRMQERESRFVIGTVCHRLMVHHPEIPVITIHDSILTTPEHVQTVHRVMMEEFQRLGVQPSIRIEGDSGSADASA